jgi:hypothetical protein
LRGADDAKLGLAGAGEYGVFMRKIGLWAGDKALRAAFQTFAYAGGFYGYHLPDMDAVADVAAPFYNNDLRGGEGHMEVGKLILNVVKSKATMTLSVKPFGCMPSSSVSDGVQSLITEKFPGTIFCAVETSGDGAVNFQSRVQMYLFKAKQAAQAELETALNDTGLTLERIQAFLKENPRHAATLHVPEHSVAHTAADLVYEIAKVIDKSRLELIGIQAQRTFKAARELALKTGSEAPEKAQAAVAFAREAAVELYSIAKEKGPGAAEAALGKAKAKLGSVLPMFKTEKAADQYATAAE